MKLWCIDSGTEQDWIAADDEPSARQIYKSHYGLSNSDMDDVAVAVVDDTDSIFVIPDETPVEDPENDEDSYELTATEVMAGMTAPGLVCSTVY